MCSTTIKPHPPPFTMISPGLVPWPLGARGNGLVLRGPESNNSCSVSTNTFCNAFVFLGFARSCSPLLSRLGFFSLAWFVFWEDDSTGSFFFNLSKFWSFFLFAGDCTDSAFLCLGFFAVGWCSDTSAPSVLRALLTHHWPGGLLCLFPLWVDELCSDFVLDASPFQNSSPVK